MAHSNALEKRLRWLFRAEIACIVMAAVNLLWGLGMLVILPGWRTVVSWTAATVATAAASYAHQVRRSLRDVPLRTETLQEPARTVSWKCPTCALEGHANTNAPAEFNLTFPCPHCGVAVPLSSGGGA